MSIKRPTYHKYLLNERGFQMWSRQLLERLGFKPTHPIPPDFSCEKVIDGVTVIVRARDPNISPRKRPHRVYAVCPDCGKQVSAGRLHQHSIIHKN